jgi:cytoskeletal protein RodZ
MSNSAGNKLREARLKQGIALEEAAHSTRIRADRLNDLEHDDYTKFPNMAYAKGFLVIYAKYLHVDVSDTAKNLGVGSPVGTQDYEYLNHVTLPVPSSVRQPKKLSMKALAMVALAVFFGAYAMRFVNNIGRLGSAEKLIERKRELMEKKTQPAAAEALHPVPLAPPPPPAPETPGSKPVPAAIPAPAPPAPALSPGPSAPAVTPETSPEIRRAEPVIHEPQSRAVSSSPSPTPATTPRNASPQQTGKSRTH